jgi:hypothetical protein
MDLIKIIIGLGAGLIDEAAASYTAKFAYAEEVARAGMFIGGLALDYVGRGGLKGVGEALEIASAPLIAKSIVKYAKKQTYTPKIRQVQVASAPAPVVRTAGLSSY